jgi:flavin-dependent dehydrogenase
MYLLIAPDPPDVRATDIFVSKGILGLPWGAWLFLIGGMMTAVGFGYSIDGKATRNSERIIQLVEERSELIAEVKELNRSINESNKKLARIEGYLNQSSRLDGE